jgi:hypothetical protein
MAYVGTPIDTRNQFQSLQGKRFNGDGSTTAFTLDVAPSSTLDIEVFVGNVRQDPNSAYTLSGTTLTFTGAPPSGTNNIYVVHQAKSVGTINVPAGGVAADSLATSVLTGQTDIGAAIADADLFLLDDGAGGTLRKTAASRIKTYIGTNTPAFMARIGSDQGSVANGTETKLNYDTEIFDSDGTYDTSNKRFTPAVAGKYFCTYAFRTLDELDDGEYAQGYFYKNGSAISPDMGFQRSYSPATNQVVTVANSMIIELDADDYVEIYMLHNEGTSITIDDKSSHFSAFRLTGMAS